MRDAALVLCVFAAFAALAGEALYAYDGFFLLASLESRSAARNLHEAFLPQLIAFGDLLSFLSLPSHRVATLFSALGVALGVGIGHRALLLLQPGDRPAARCATMLVLTAPPIVFFATVVEYHGFFFAYAQLALLGAAFLIRRPSARWAVALGAAIAAASLVHSSGILLPAILLPMVMAEARSVTPARRGILCCYATVSFAVLLLVGRETLRAVLTPLPMPLPGLSSALIGIPYVPHVLVGEWLLPFAPVALGALLALASRGTRSLAVALWVGVLAYSFVAAGMLYDVLWERGAYLLPLVGPAALLSVRALPRSWVWALVVLGGCAAILQVRWHASGAELYPRFVQGVAAATAPAAPVALVFAQPERAAIAVLRPAWRVIDLGDVLAQPGDMIDATVATIGSWLPALTSEGRQLAISEASMGELRRAGDHGGRLADAILARCDARDVTVPGFKGQVLRLRTH